MWRWVQFVAFVAAALGVYPAPGLYGMEVAFLTNAFVAGDLEKEFRIRAWTTENGLPQNTVNCLFQSSEGYFWIGTQDGLARLDGVRFEVFDRQNVPLFRNACVNALAEHPPGCLWVGTAAGLLRYLEHQFEWIPLPGEAPRVHSICVRRCGEVWLGTERGPMRRKAPMR